MRNLQIIKQATNEYAGYNVFVKGRETANNKVLFRQFSQYFARTEFRHTLKLAKIGKELGDKDHATVLHSEKKIKSFLQAKKPCNNFMFPEIRHLYFDYKSYVRQKISEKNTASRFISHDFETKRKFFTNFV